MMMMMMMMMMIIIIITPYSILLLEKLTVTRLVKKFPAFYGTLRFTIVFTIARHWSLSLTRCIHPRKVRALTLLLQVGTLWRCGDGLFFEVIPLAFDALLTTLHPLLENVLQTVDHFEISCLGAPFPWLEKNRNRMGRDLDCMADVLMGFHRSTFSKPNTELNSDLAPCDFWAFPTMKRELRGKRFRSDQRSAAYLREVGGAL
jgi:hypothetical protein